MNKNLYPGFLVAPPNLNDPYFKHAVVGLTSHEPEGSMGFILSHTLNVTLHELLADLSIVPHIPDRQVLFGGPMSKNSGFVVYEHPKEQPVAMGLLLADDMSVSPAREALEMAAEGKLPGRFELILGYSGWGPGQLDKEIHSGGWLHTPYFPELIFDVPMSERWQYAYECLGVSPFSFVSVPGGAHA